MTTIKIYNDKNELIREMSGESAVVCVDKKKGCQIAIAGNFGFTDIAKMRYKLNETLEKEGMELIKSEVNNISDTQLGDMIKEVIGENFDELIKSVREDLK
jgi:hypothetical protein